MSDEPHISPPPPNGDARPHRQRIPWIWWLIPIAGVAVAIAVAFLLVHSFEGSFNSRLAAQNTELTKALERTPGGTKKAKAILGKSTPGPAGAAGAIGPRGARGPRGYPGVDGSNGIDGSDGSNGKNGAAGSNGKNGAAGENGAPGIAGPRGAAGETGSIGETGATGPAGKNGITAPCVTSATQCVGPIGKQGAVGPAGPTGPAGENGQNGQPGSQGPAGTLPQTLTIKYSNGFVGTCTLSSDGSTYSCTETSPPTTS
jgi:Collagen triple helix repeat (20 copies)